MTLKLPRSPFSVLRSPLSAVRSPLSAVRCPLSVVRYPSSAIRYPLTVFRFALQQGNCGSVQDTGCVALGEEPGQETLAFADPLHLECR